MNPNDEFIPIDHQQSVAEIVDDLAYEPIRVLQLNHAAMSVAQCEACYRIWTIGYAVWVEDPFCTDLHGDEYGNWHKWGIVCFDCMAQVVAKAGFRCTQQGRVCELVEATWLHITPMVIVLVTVIAICLYFDRNRDDDSDDEE